MATSKTKTPFSAMAGSADPSMLNDTFTSMMRAQATMMDSLLKQNIEVLDFLKGRYEKDRAMLSALTKVENPNDALSIWSGFWSNTMSDYTNEAGKLSAYAAAATEQMIEGVTEEAKAMAGAAMAKKKD